ADTRRLRRERHFFQHIKNFVGKEGEEEKSDRGEDRTENLAAINLRSSKCAEQTEEQQRSANAEEQKIRPWKIPRDRKLREKFVTEQTADRDNEADPEWPVPVPLHVDLAEAIPRIQR